MNFPGAIDSSVSGTANYRGGQSDYRALIAQALAASNPPPGGGAPPPTPFSGFSGGTGRGVGGYNVPGTANYNPALPPTGGDRGGGGMFGAGPQYQYDEVTSDPVMGDKTLGDLYGSLPTPTITLNPGDLVDDPTSPPDHALEAPTNQQQMQQAELDSIIAQAPEQSATTGPGFDAGAAIAADVAGGLTGLNAGVNDAVAGMGFDSSGAPAGPGESGPGGGGGGGAGGGGNK